MRYLNSLLYDEQGNVSGYIDTVGGQHEEGLGWSPDGEFCGECSSSTCEGCSQWKKMCT